MLIRENRYYWTDENGNKWSKNIYDRLEVEQVYAPSLDNCYGCVDCTFSRDLIDCHDCHESERLTNSTSCIRCYDATSIYKKKDFSNKCYGITA